MTSRDEKKKKVIEVLNRARSMELQAITQYMNQHYGIDAMDYGELAGKIKLIAVDEMRHAEMFAERVKELGGEPVTEPAGNVQKGQKIEEIYPYDVDQEDHAIEAYNGFLQVCMDNGDSTSAKIFEAIIDEEQIHLNYFENIGSHIKELGASYLAQLAGTPSATGLGTKGFAAQNV